MEFRRSEVDAPVCLSFQDFCILAASGQVPPDAWYRTPWSGGWRTVDNYPLFHALSPTKYPIGVPTADEKRHEEARRARNEDYWRQQEHYKRLITENYKLLPLAEIARDEHRVGVSRLTLRAIGEFRERIVTLAFGERDIDVEILGIRNPISWFLPWPPEDEEISFEHKYNAALPFGPEDVIRHSGRVPYTRAPKICETWKRFLQYVLRAESCDSFSFDGTAFQHEILNGDQIFAATWRNPHPPKFAYQCRVVRAYRRLTRTAGLLDLFRQVA
jgi:hypothetical protein